MDYLVFLIVPVCVLATLAYSAAVGANNRCDRLEREILRLDAALDGKEDAEHVWIGGSRHKIVRGHDVRH